MTCWESKVTQEVMGSHFDQDQTPESDHEAGQSIKDAAQADIETRKLETLWREADRLLDLIQEAELAPIETSQPTPTAAARADGPGADAQPLIQPTESPAKAEPLSPRGWPLILPMLGLAVAVGFAIRGGVGNAPSNEAVQEKPPSARLGYTDGKQANNKGNPDQKQVLTDLQWLKWNNYSIFFIFIFIALLAELHHLISLPGFCFHKA